MRRVEGGDKSPRAAVLGWVGLPFVYGTVTVGLCCGAGLPGNPTNI